MTQVFTLVLALLTTESSYSQEVERPASTVADTIQFWLGSESQWRIRTYAVDHDIHIYNLGSPKEKGFSSASAIEHINKHYEGIIAKTITLQFSNPNDPKEVQAVLAKHNLKGALEVAKAGFAFYNSDNEKYKTISAPKK